MVTDDPYMRLNALLHRLSPKLQREAVDLIESLVELHGLRKKQAEPPKPSRIRFDGWAGCLSQMDETAVTMQHKTMRSGGVDD